MTILGSTFIFAVLTAYTLYRYFITQNDFLADLTLVHVNWNVFYSIFTTMIIYAGSIVKWKVKNILEQLNLCWKIVKNSLFIGCRLFVCRSYIASDVGQTSGRHLP